jgi:hypothetical protein
VLHAVLAVDSTTGELLGLVETKVSNRDKGKVTSRRLRATADKESQRWIDSAARSGEVLADARSITIVSDRESDIRVFRAPATQRAPDHAGLPGSATRA